MKPEELAPVMYAAMARAVADWGIEVPGWDDVTCANTGDLAAVRDGWLAAAEEAIGQLDVMDDLTEANAIIEALREDHGRTDRYRQALEDARRVLSSIALGTARDPSVAADNAAVKIRRALDGQP